MECEYCNNIKYMEIGIYGEFGKRTFGENRPADTDSIVLCSEKCDLSKKISTLKGTEIKYCSAVRR